MAKSFQERVQAYSYDVREHFDRAKKGEIGWGEALRGLWLETRKLAYRATKGETTHGRKHAIDLVKRGMKEYNAKRYPEAEELFRRATGKDSGYGRAHAYLGNALYKQKRLTDAVTAWNKAVEVEPNSDAADMAKEKLLSVGKPREGGLEMVNNLARTRG